MIARFADQDSIVRANFNTLVFQAWRILCTVSRLVLISAFNIDPARPPLQLCVWSPFLILVFLQVCTSHSHPSTDFATEAQNRQIAMGLPAYGILGVVNAEVFWTMNKVTTFEHETLYQGTSLKSVQNNSVGCRGPIAVNLAFVRILVFGAIC